MGEVRCGKCGEVWDVADGDAPVESDCPDCISLGTETFREVREGPSGAASSVQTDTFEPIEVVWGIGSEACQTDLDLSGNLTFASGCIHITPIFRRSWAVAGGAFGLGFTIAGPIGAVAALLGTKPWAKAPPSPVEIDVAASEAIYDEQRELFSLRLRDGKWVSLKAGRWQWHGYSRLMGVVLSAYPGRMRPERLGRKPRTINVGLGIAWAVTLFVLAVFLFLVGMSRLQRYRRQSHRGMQVCPSLLVAADPASATGTASRNLMDIYCA